MLSQLPLSTCVLDTATLPYVFATRPPPTAAAMPFFFFSLSYRLTLILSSSSWTPLLQNATIFGKECIFTDAVSHLGPPLLSVSYERVAVTAPLLFVNLLVPELAHPTLPHLILDYAVSQAHGLSTCLTYQSCSVYSIIATDDPPTSQPDETAKPTTSPPLR